MLKNTLHFLLSYLNITEKDGINFLLKVCFALKITGGIIISLSFFPYRMPTMALWLFAALLIIVGLLPSWMIRTKYNGIHRSVFLDEIAIPFAFIYFIDLVLRASLFILS